MGYVPTVWTDGSTAVSQAVMNHIENGVAACLQADGSVALTASLLLATGHQESGVCGNQAYSLSGDTVGWVGKFANVMTNTPSSITLSALNTNRVSGAITLVDIQKTGFLAFIVANGTGWARWYGTYTTVGNCLLAVVPETRTFDHHCDHCRHVALDVPFSDLAVVADPGASRRGRWTRFWYRLTVALRLRAPEPPAPWLPGHSAVSYQCRNCGVWECFNTALDAAAEADETLMANPRSTYRVTYGEQAARVRALLRALGKPLIDDPTEITAPVAV